MWVPGARLGKYKLVERLGKGGMAETWRAELLAAQGVRKAVVIKRVLPAFSDNKEFIEAFVQEAKVTASLSHGNIAQVFDFGQVADSHFIAMELIDGRSLDRVLKRGIAKGYWHMPYTIATLITLEVAKGLEHVHTRRGPNGPLDIVHRDISPDNVIVGLNGETKLVDFGVAKSVVEGRAETEAGIIKGKYIYFSPEQAAGERVDFRTDIYALGVVLYRLVTGKKAFDGPNLKVLQQVQRGEFVPLRVANPNVPDDLATVIETMMATRRQDRFESTLELVEALSACLVRMAPRAGVHWIRDWVRWLYQEDLEKRGEEPGLRAGFTELIAQWKPEPRPTETGELVVSGESKQGDVGTVSSRRAGSQRRASEAEPPPVPPWTFKKKLYMAGVGGAVMAALVGFIALTSTRDPGEGESDDARRRRIADALRMKPLDDSTLARPPPQPGEDEAPTPANPAGAEPAAAAGQDEPPEPSGEDEVHAQNVPTVQYDAELAPVTFTLTSHHQVSLDEAPTMPGGSGVLTGAGPLTSGNAARAALTFPDMGDPTGMGGGTKGWAWVNPNARTTANASDDHRVPAWLFTPGKTPVLELLANGTGRWSQRDARLVVLTGSASEVRGSQLNPVAGGKRLAARGSMVVVDPRDRFSISDLSARQTWKVTLTPKPQKGETTGPVVIFLEGGNGVRVDGKATVGGYAMLTPGSHRISGATSAWLTVPTLASLKLGAIEVSFGP